MRPNELFYDLELFPTAFARVNGMDKRYADLIEVLSESLQERRRYLAVTPSVAHEDSGVAFHVPITLRCHMIHSTTSVADRKQ